MKHHYEIHTLHREGQWHVQGRYDDFQQAATDAIQFHHKLGDDWRVRVIHVKPLCVWDSEDARNLKNHESKIGQTA